VKRPYFEGTSTVACMSSSTDPRVNRFCLQK